MNYTITKEQVLETVRTGTDVTKRYLNEILPEAFKPELKAGQWYIASCMNNHGYLILAAEIADNNTVTSNYWFSPSKSYVDVTGTFDSVERLATEEEVSAALIAEAKKRGFVEGKTITWSDNPSLKYTLDEGSFEYRKNPTRLMFGIYAVMQDGLWATIQPEEKKEEKPAEKTLEIIKGENYICRKDSVILGTDGFFFKRGSTYRSDCDRFLVSDTGRNHATTPKFAFKYFLHLPK